jgi:branched-chain amino acid transport system permease protein
LLGAALVIPFENFLRAELADTLPGLNLAILGLLMVLAALFMKRGVVGLIVALAARRAKHRSAAKQGAQP